MAGQEVTAAVPFHLLRRRLLLRVSFSVCLSAIENCKSLLLWKKMMCWYYFSESSYDLGFFLSMLCAVLLRILCTLLVWILVWVSLCLVLWKLLTSATAKCSHIFLCSRIKRNGSFIFGLRPEVCPVSRVMDAELLLKPGEFSVAAA